MGWRERPYHKSPQTKTCDRTLPRPALRSGRVVPPPPPDDSYPPTLPLLLWHTPRGAMGIKRVVYSLCYLDILRTIIYLYALRRLAFGGTAYRRAVYLHPAAKYRRLTPRLSQEQKGLDERTRMASQWPSPPGDAFDAGHVTARRLLRPPPCAASSHPACSYPYWLRPRRHAKEQHFA